MPHRRRHARTWRGGVVADLLEDAALLRPVDGVRRAGRVAAQLERRLQRLAREWHRLPVAVRHHRGRDAHADMVDDGPRGERRTHATQRREGRGGDDEADQRHEYEVRRWPILMTLVEIAPRTSKSKRVADRLALRRG